MDVKTAYIGGMTRLAVPILIATFAATPLVAQDDTGPSLMEQGAKLFFKGLMEEMEPAMDELEGLAQEMGPLLDKLSAEMAPVMEKLLDEVDDWAAYQLPETLPNGDIIIRRKTPKQLDDGDDGASADENEKIDL